MRVFLAAIAGALLIAVSSPKAALADSRAEVNQMIRAYNALHTVTAHASAHGKSWTVQYQAPDKYKLSFTPMDAVVIGPDVWILNGRGWRHLPRGSGDQIQSAMYLIRIANLLGGTAGYRVTDRGVSPGLGHEYEFRASGQHGWVWIRPDHLPSQLRLSTGVTANYYDFNRAVDIQAPRGAAEQ